MRSLDVSDENFKSERDVVKEERRLRIENPPFGRLLEVVFENTYKTHPYRILPIGSMADLDAATLQDVRDFHTTYYVPNNATLVVTGDFDPGQVMRWVEKYFGPIPKGEADPARDPQGAGADGRAPRGRLPRQHAAAGRGDHLPRARGASTRTSTPCRWRATSSPPARARGSTGGWSTRSRWPSAPAARHRARGPRACSSSSPSSRAARSPRTARRSCMAEVERLKRRAGLRGGAGQGQEPAHLRAGLRPPDRARTRRTRSATPSVILDDVSLVNRQLAEYQKVTAADVQRVASTYFNPENRTVVYMLPEAMRPAANRHRDSRGTEQARGEAMRASRSMNLLALSCCWPAARRPSSARSIADSRKATPPPPAPAKDVRFPAFEQKTLANGLRVVVIEQHEQPLVSLRMMLKAGKVFEPAEKAGLAEATADAADQGDDHPLGAADRRDDRLRGRQPRGQHGHRSRLRRRLRHRGPARPRVRAAVRRRAPPHLPARRSSSAGAGRP